MSRFVLSALSTLGAIVAIGFAPLAIAQDADGHAHAEGETHAHSKTDAPMPEGVFSEVAGDHAIGEKAAPVTLIVFASVTCPHCAVWFKEDYPVIKRDYVDTDKLRLVFREFPTAPAQVAVAGFLIAACGSDEDYFPAIEYQMAHQEQTLEALIAGDIKETFDGLGEQSGLNPEQVEACLADKDGFDALNETVARARAAGLKGVPSMMINGVVYPGKDVSASALSTVIDALIASK
ncbi:MAG: thioredoxin domain-containing protein [Robiginitomaculum sp.]